MTHISDLKSKSKNHVYKSILSTLISKYFLALGLIILFETFVCNYLFFRNIGNDEIVYAIEDSADSGIIYNNLTVAEPGVLCADSNEDVYIELDGLNVPGKGLYIDLKDILWIGDSKETSLDFLIQMKDESHHRFYNRGGVKTISALIEQTKYISLRSMGQMNDLRIEFKNVATGDFIYIDNIVVNRKRPLFFSLGRILLFFILFLAAYHLRSGSELYKSKYDISIRWQGWVTGITVILLLYISLQLSGYLTQAAKTWHDNPYDSLAHAMADGKVNLNEEITVDESLAQLDDPYVPDNRAGIPYEWDCAFYEGKYYVYYGVVPEILIYLPHYAVTKKDLGVLPAGRIELALMIIGIFMCFIELGNRMRGKIPYITWLLLFVASTGGVQVILLSRAVTFYDIPVTMGCALLLWGIYFWMTSSKEDEKKYSTPRLLAGSICMALTAGCRPQLILGSLIAIPIFMGYFIETGGRSSAEEKSGGVHIRKVNPKETARYLTAGLLPYVIILGLLFYYNQIRFGNPFEFGAKYNLTAIDVTRVRADMGKLVPGLFMYLFIPPKMSTVFPFIENNTFTSSYTGDFFSHFSNGGFMICNPLTLFIFFGLQKRHQPKDTWIRGIFFACLIVSAAIIFINLMVGGFMPRYFCDFAPFMYMAGLIIVCSWIKAADERTLATLLPVLSLLCIVTIIYHFLTYYIGDGGSYFNRYDREVFLRAALTWQWWE